MENTDIIKQSPVDLRELTWSRSVGSLASDGVFLKADKIINGITYYLKLSNYDSFRGIFGHEAVNELIACRLGKLLGFPVVEGELIKSFVTIDGKEHFAYVFIAKSYRTTQSRDSFENYYFSYRLSNEESPLDFCKRCNWGTQIYKMFIFDYLIINRDRHGANLEVLKNSDIFLSPFFDNGLSFVCSYTDGIGLDTFSVLYDKPVNNFIGSRSLEKNLSFIDEKIVFNKLKESDKLVLFAGLKGILAEEYFDKIWEIIWRREQNVKIFRVI